MSKSKYVITVNRQFGSMGRPIAKLLAEKLQIGYYDRDLIDEAAKELGLPASVVDKAEEKADSRVFIPFRNMAYPLGRGEEQMQEKINAAFEGWEIQILAVSVMEYVVLVSMEQKEEEELSKLLREKMTSF